MQRRGRGVLEDEVLDAVRAAARPATVTEVVAALPGPAAYTTVLTTMRRLHDLGALTRDHRGRAFTYSPAPSAVGLASARSARDMRRLLDRAGDRANVLAVFVAGLDPPDEVVVRRLLLDRHRPADLPPDRGRDPHGPRRAGSERPGRQAPPTPRVRG